MDSIKIITIVASLLGGGAVGAIITAVVTWHRNRVQPVGRRLEVTPVFTIPSVASTLKPIITVTHGGGEHKLQNLFVADLQVVNNGNRDAESFTFGVTLSPSDQAIWVEPYGLDRHHVAQVTTPVSPAQKSEILDFCLTPFNRGDSYTIKIMIVAAGEKPGEISISSSEPIRFIEMPTLAETIKSIAAGNLIKIGPLEVRLPR